MARTMPIHRVGTPPARRHDGPEEGDPAVPEVDESRGADARDARRTRRAWQARPAWWILAAAGLLAAAALGWLAWGPRDASPSALTQDVEARTREAIRWARIAEAAVVVDVVRAELPASLRPDEVRQRAQEAALRVRAALVPLEGLDAAGWSEVSSRLDAFERRLRAGDPAAADELVPVSTFLREATP